MTIHELRTRPGAWPLGTMLRAGRQGDSWQLSVESAVIEQRNLPLRSAGYASLQELCLALYRDDPADPLAALPNPLIQALGQEAALIPARKIGAAAYEVSPANTEDFDLAMVGWSKAWGSFWVELYEDRGDGAPSYTFPDAQLREEAVCELAQFLCRTYVSAVIPDEVATALVRDQQGGRP